MKFKLGETVIYIESGRKIKATIKECSYCFIRTLNFDTTITQKEKTFYLLSSGIQKEESELQETLGLTS